MIDEEIVYIKGKPQKLVVFLHGYQDRAEHIARKTELLQKLDNVAIHIPQAPFENEIDKDKKQWFSIHKFDPNDRRRSDAISWDEFVECYNKMTVGLVEANRCILEYADKTLNKYGLGYEDLFLCGFSQGAMCAIYTGLMCPYKIAGIISFSGILAANGYLEKHNVNSPDCLLLHGNKDDKIKIKALDFTAENMKNLGCSVETYEIKDSAHQISIEAVEKACRFIEKRS